MASKLKLDLCESRERGSIQLMLMISIMIISNNKSIKMDQDNSNESKLDRCGTKCLFFDLNGTLIFRNKNGKIRVRPQTVYVLKELAKTYDVYIVTSMIMKNALISLKGIDKQWQV